MTPWDEQHGDDELDELVDGWDPSKEKSITKLREELRFVDLEKTHIEIKRDMLNKKRDMNDRLLNVAETNYNKEQAQHQLNVSSYRDEEFHLDRSEEERQSLRFKIVERIKELEEDAL